MRLCIVACLLLLAGCARAPEGEPTGSRSRPGWNGPMYFLEYGDREVLVTEEEFHAKRGSDEVAPASAPVWYNAKNGIPRR